MSTQPPTVEATPRPTPSSMERSAASSPQRSRKGRTRWPWMILGVVIVLGKAEAYRHLLVHPATLIGILAVGLAVCVLRTSPVGVAVGAAGLIAFAIGPASTLVGIALAIAAFAVLMMACFAISTGLLARQNRRLR